MRAVPIDREAFQRRLNTTVQHVYNARSYFGLCMSEAETLDDLQAVKSAILKASERMLDAEQQCEFRLRDMRDAIARRQR